MCVSNLLLVMMGTSMIRCSYACAAFPATSSRSLLMNLVMNTRMNG